MILPTRVLLPAASKLLNARPNSYLTGYQPVYSQAHHEWHPVALKVQVDGAAGNVCPGAFCGSNHPEALWHRNDPQRLASTTRQDMGFLRPEPLRLRDM